MARQYVSMMDVNNPPIANGSALTNTAEELMWATTDFTRINANESFAGKQWIIRAGGIFTFNSTGLLSFTPRLGLVIGSATMGVTVNPVNVPGVVTAGSWFMETLLTCRTIGAAGANSTFICNGVVTLAGIATAGQAVCVTFGGTSATADASIATGFTFTKTLTVAGSFTVEQVSMVSLN